MSPPPTTASNPVPPPHPPTPVANENSAPLPPPHQPHRPYGVSIPPPPDEPPPEPPGDDQPPPPPPVDLMPPPPPPPTTPRDPDMDPPPPPPPPTSSEPQAIPPPPPPTPQGRLASPPTSNPSSGPVPPRTSSTSSSTNPSIPQPPTHPPSASSDQDHDRLLSRESLSFFQELEIERVLTAFKLNPYDVLEVPLEADEKLINKIYRKKSLLLHPDKVKHERAVEAFDLLKKASLHLLDEDRRRTLDETVLSAKYLVLKEELHLPLGLPSDADQLKDLNPSFQERVRRATKTLMIDDELRRRKALRMQHAMEGDEERKREEALAERKRKADEKVMWEDTRDERVAGWRAFARGGAGVGKKRKKAGAEVLG